MLIEEDIVIIYSAATFLCFAWNSWFTDVNQLFLMSYILRFFVDEDFFSITKAFLGPSHTSVMDLDLKPLTSFGKSSIIDVCQWLFVNHRSLYYAIL